MTQTYEHVRANEEWTLHVKTLTGQSHDIKVSPYITAFEMNTLVATEVIKTNPEMVNTVFKGAKLLSLNRAFNTIKDIGINDGDSIYAILNLGGPDPSFRAVVQLARLSPEERSLWDLTKMYDIIKNDSNKPMECPLCMEFAVIRFTDCYHWMCKDCFHSLEENSCPYCRKENVTLL